MRSYIKCGSALSILDSAVLGSSMSLRCVARFVLGLSRFLHTLVLPVQLLVNVVDVGLL